MRGEWRSVGGCGRVYGVSGEVCWRMGRVMGKM